MKTKDLMLCPSKTESRLFVKTWFLSASLIFNVLTTTERPSMTSRYISPPTIRASAPKNV
jgi:hypothetical protein